MGYKIDSDILFDLIHSELKVFLSPLNSVISDDRIRHFEIAIGGIIKKAGELTDAEASKKGDLLDRDKLIEFYCRRDCDRKPNECEYFPCWEVKNILDMPAAQPDNRIAKIADLVEGTIDHFDLDDAMDLLYQIKEVIQCETD